MSSLPSEIGFRPRSLSGVRDVIESYRRAQEYLSESVSASASGTSDDEDFQESQQSPIEEEEEIDIEAASETSQGYNDALISLQWDEDLTPGPSQRDGSHSTRPFLLPAPRRTSTRISSTSIPTATTPTPKVEERSPLLIVSPAESYGGCPTRAASVVEASANTQTAVPGAMVRNFSQRSLQRESTDNRNIASKSETAPGHSTFGQTLYNAIAILLGVGILSEPLAFAFAGWIGGTVIIILYGLITCYTAKILAHIIIEDPRLRSYSDIGRKAFGPRSGPWISAVFCLELFTVSVALVTLYADSLYAVIPSYSPGTYKLIGLIFLIPTMLLPLSVLSYTSIIGIVSTLLIIAVILIDGFSKPDSPGSLWSPAETSLGVRHLGELGLSFGLFMAGFSGHAVIPSLVIDMVDPTQFDTMITRAFTVATTIYAIIGIAGYIMFGNSVSDEFSQDLAKYSVYPVLNKIALWGLVLSPLSKFALATRPLNLTLEMMLGIETGTVSLDDHGGAKPTSQNGEAVTNGHKRHRARNQIFTTIERTLFTLCSVTVSIVVPEFSSMMAFLGAFSSFLICVIGPVSAKIALARHCGLLDALLLVAGLIMATWGTIAAFWSMQ